MTVTTPWDLARKLQDYAESALVKGDAKKAVYIKVKQNGESFEICLYAARNYAKVYFRVGSGDAKLECDHDSAWRSEFTRLIPDACKKILWDNNGGAIVRTEVLPVDSEEVKSMGVKELKPW